ncbi:MAG: PAS domain S-box protein [candidate division NC10 bacterium]|nr:PAS domain S-box protein [candidate division NC10 bacterium]
MTSAERQPAEEVLRESEARYQNLFNGVPVGLYRTTPAGQFLDVNPALVEILGYPDRESLLAVNAVNVYVNPEDRQRWKALMERDGVVSGFEVRFARGDGKIIWVENNARVVRDADGRVLYYEGSNQDITERKRAEAAYEGLYRASIELQESLTIEKRLDRLLQTARGILELDRLNVLLADSEGRWLCAVACLGVEEPLEAIRVPIGPEGGGLAHAYLTKQPVVWGGGGPVPPELRLKPPYDAIEAFRSRVFAILPLVVEGRAIGVLGGDRKRTQKPLDAVTLELFQLFAGQAALSIDHARLFDAQARRAEELARSNAELEQFGSVASHDLQEPLRMVASFTQLLAKRYRGKLDAEADEFIAYAVDGATRMQRLINDLLTYSRVGRLGKPFELTDCEAVLDRTLADLRVTIEENGAVITHDPLPTLMADVTQLRQLFQNLIGNALKFRSDKPTEVRVGAERTDGTWLFSIRDNGIGIDPQQQDRVFVIFQRLHTRDEYPGTGIGLAICRRIVEQHGGRIWVESEPGKGATFYFTLSDGGGPLA